MSDKPKSKYVFRLTLNRRNAVVISWSLEEAHHLLKLREPKAKWEDADCEIIAYTRFTRTSRVVALERE